MRRWALPAALLGLFLIASAVAAMPAPAATVQDTADAVSGQVDSGVAAATDLANTLVAPDPGTGQGGQGGGQSSQAGSSGGSGGQTGAGPTIPATPDVAQTIQDVQDLAPVSATEVVALVSKEAHEAAEQVPDDLNSLSPLASNDEPGATQPAPTSQTAAALPAGSLMIAGSILVVGATAAAATYVIMWLAGSSGTLTAGAATPELRRLLPFASPLFTRFERDTVLGHPRREQLYARILQEPGISLQDLGQATGLSRTAVVHHLRLLEQQHLVISRRVGRSRHYYENGGRYGHDQKEAYAILRNDRSKAVAEFIRSHPGTMQKSLCEALSIPPSIAHWHVRRLSEGGLVETIRQGRAVAYFPGAALSSVFAGPQLEATPAVVPS